MSDHEGRSLARLGIRRVGRPVAWGAGAALSAVGLAAVSGWLISRAAEQPPVLFLITAVVGVRALGLARAVLRYRERLAAHDVALRWQAEIRVAVYRRLQASVWVGRGATDALSRVINDTAAVIDRVTGVIVPRWAALITAVVITAAMIIISPAAGTVIGVGLLIGGVLVPALAARALRGPEARQAEWRGRLSEATAELAFAADDLVALGAAEAYRQRIATLQRETARTERRIADLVGVATAAQLATIGATVVAAVGLGAGEVAAGSLAPVLLAVLALTPLALAEVIAPLVPAARLAGRSRAALDRLAGVGSDESASVSTSTSHGDPNPAEKPSLRLTDLAIGWPDRPVLAEGLDLHVGAGERVAVVGRSGAGKTTLAATLLGMIPPRAGSVEVIGRIGYLAQDAYLFDTTVAENLRIAAPDADRDEMVEVLRRVGLGLDLDTAIGEHGARLSGGEGRRLALARLLLTECEVIIVDEPTEHLDAVTATAVLDDLIAATGHAAVMIITHDPAVIHRCDRVLRIGRLSPARR